MFFKSKKGDGKMIMKLVYFMISLLYLYAFYSVFITGATVDIEGIEQTQGGLHASAAFARIISSPECLSTGEAGVLDENKLSNMNGENLVECAFNPSIWKYVKVENLETGQTYEIGEEGAKLYPEIEEEALTRRRDSFEPDFPLETEYPVNPGSQDFEYSSAVGRNDIEEDQYEVINYMRGEFLFTDDVGGRGRRIYVDYERGDITFDYSSKVNIKNSNGELELGKITVHTRHAKDPVVQMSQHAYFVREEGGEHRFNITNPLEDGYEIEGTGNRIIDEGGNQMWLRDLELYGSSFEISGGSSTEVIFEKEDEHTVSYMPMD